MERDIVKKARRTLHRMRCKVRLDQFDEGPLADYVDVRGPGGQPERVLRLGSRSSPRTAWPSAVADLHSRQVVVWSLQSHMQASLVKDAFLMACIRRLPPPDLIFHSDRGSQLQRRYLGTLQPSRILSSMSRKGNCWDNAPTESPCGRLKTACVHCGRFTTRDQARQAIMDWLAIYNHSRLHSALGYVSPMRFEQRWLPAQLKSAA